MCDLSASRPPGCFSVRGAGPELRALLALLILSTPPPSALASASAHLLFC